jgi:uncharacterized protein YlxW (UPF0749 family)
MSEHESAHHGRHELPPDAKPHRELRALRRPTVFGVLAVVLCVVLGAAIATQVRQTESGDALETARPADLVVLLDSLQQREAALNKEVSDLQRTLAALNASGSDDQAAVADAQGRELLSRLDELGFVGASTKVAGPGLTVTLTDPGASPDLSDVSKERIPGSRQVVLDRDLQLVVNSLWASGAEAIAVGGVRIGPNVTIRQAGGAILVDNQPVSSPYAIVAIGPPHGLQDEFERSPGYVRMRLLEASYGVGATVSTSDSLTVPAGSSREVKYAKPIG